MFDFSLAELLVVVAAAVIFIGPKDVPVILRALARGMKTLREFGAEIRKTFDDLAKESGAAAASEDIKENIRLIQGDDGKLYESYDTRHLSASSDKSN